ncbi:hypothetical protein ABH973_000125 [Bradyrhizobium ottawaense]|uniref:hypothetical protein n=1 Tax=Bradyrhizobium ottawaense TaxID=931866 RepID=UPI0035144F90
MKKVHVGLEVKLPKGGCLFITDEFLDLPDWRHPRRFDPLHDSFNPLADLDYAKACSIFDIFDALFVGGPATQAIDLARIRSARAKSRSGSA